MPTLTLLTESVDYSQASVDHEQHIIRGVAVLQQQSVNNRFYTEEVIRKSAAIFDEVPVTVRGAHDRANRDYNSQNGVLRNGRYDADRVMSLYDWHLNEADELTPKILVDAAKFPGNIPLSVEIGDWTQEEDETGDGPVRITDVTDQKRLLGVAAVYRGGTNRTIFESDKEPTMIKTVADLKEKYPELCGELVECECEKLRSQVSEAKDRVSELMAERDTLTGKIKEIDDELASYRAEEQKQKQEAEIREYVQKELGADYQIKEEELENYLFLYEDDRYKKTVKLIKDARAQSTSIDESDDGDKPQSRGGVGDTAKEVEYDDLLEYEIR